jgi:flagellar hook-associated protein 2
MASMGIDGLVSGLNTTDLINQLMSVESAPQTALKTKQSETTKLVTALQAMNVKVASLAQSATKAATAASWNATKATSSAASVTGATSATSQPTALSFTVDAVATGQISLTKTTDLAALVGAGKTLTIKAADGTLTEIAAGTDAASTASAISSSKAGVSAVAVTVGGGTRLQLTSTATGLTHGFEVFVGTAADVTAGTATQLSVDEVQKAGDAKITLWAGVNGVEQQVSSASNTFTDVLGGTSFTVSKVETDPVTLTVSRDTAALTSLGSSLVSSLSLVFSEISSQTASSTTTDSDGRSIVTGGVLSGTSQVRTLQQSLQSAASYPVDGVSPSAVGISMDKDGNFTFDQAKFTAALAADPEKVQKVMVGIAQRVADVANAASDSKTGTLTQEITGQQGLVKDLGDQIDSWDTRLALRKEGLQATYSALEVTLSGLQSQSSWLAGQLASLPSYS